MIFTNSSAKPSFSTHVLERNKQTSPKQQDNKSSLVVVKIASECVHTYTHTHTHAHVCTHTQPVFDLRAGFNNDIHDD